MTNKEWFPTAKFGMMIHFGLYALPAGEWKGQRMDYIGEWIQSKFRIPNAEYEQLAGAFNPVCFNAEEWVLTAKAAGEAVITLIGEACGMPVTKDLTVTVQEGKILSAKLTAEQTTFKPQADAVQLTFTAYGADGGAVDVQSVSYLSGDPQHAQLFKGSYLQNYSWGERTLAELCDSSNV